MNPLFNTTHFHCFDDSRRESLVFQFIDSSNRNSSRGGYLSISTDGCVSLFRISEAAPLTDCATMR